MNSTASKKRRLQTSRSSSGGGGGSDFPRAPRKEPKVREGSNVASKSKTKAKSAAIVDLTAMQKEVETKVKKNWHKNRDPFDETVFTEFVTTNTSSIGSGGNSGGGDSDFSNHDEVSVALQAQSIQLRTG